MADAPVLTVEPSHAGPVGLQVSGYAAVCSEHGPLTWWTQQLFASLDLLGHAAHFHSRPLPAADGHGVP